MAENFDDDSELPAPESPVGKPRRPSAAQCVIDAAIAKAVPRGLRLRFLGGDVLTAVVCVPSASWVKPVDRRSAQLLGKSWSSIARDGSTKMHSADTGNDEVTALLAKSRSVLGIASSEKTLPSALVVTADIRIEIRTPDAAVVADAVRRYTSETVPLAMSVAAGGLDFHQLCAAFRPGSSAWQIIDRIKGARRLLAPDLADIHQDLEDAVEYGSARIWGLELAQGLADCIAGTSKWSDISHSALMYGEPGLGKTHYAELLSRKMKATLILTSVADLFANSSGYLDGVVKELISTYDRAERSSPSLVVWDEIEALPSRVGLDSRSSSYWGTVITRFMIEVSKYRPLVAQLAITNFKERVDPALLRPGRFGTHLELTRPDEAAVASILRAQLGGDLQHIDLAQISRMAGDRTAAELMEAVRRARQVARTAGRPLQLSDIEQVFVPHDAIPAKDLRHISVHEAGHVVVALALDTDQVVLAAIGGRAGAHGHTALRRSGNLEALDVIEARVTMTLAGRAAEIALLGNCVAGSSSDLREATLQIGSLIIAEGMGETLAHIGGSSSVESMLQLDRPLRNEVEERLQRLSARAIEIVKRHRCAVEAIASVLAERRYVGGDEAKRIFLESN